MHPSFGAGRVVSVRTQESAREYGSRTHVSSTYASANCIRQI